MRFLIHQVVTSALSVVLVSCLSQRSEAQFTKPIESELTRTVTDRLRAEKYDEAIALLTKAAAEPGPGADVGQALFTTAQFFFVHEKYESSLALLKRITERFPDSPMASLASCGMGQVYGKLGDTDKMIAALERGMADPRKFTEMNIMDASDTHNYACQSLGEHYINTAQWEKALKIYTDWRPNSWCGTCWEGMQEARANSILLCHAHLGNFSVLSEQAWRDFVRNSQTRDQLEIFLLVRSYAEAGQLNDLEFLADRLYENAALRHPAELSESNKNFLSTVRKATAALATSIDHFRQKDLSTHVGILESENTSPLSKHVARWTLIRDAKHSVPVLKTAALKARPARGEFMTLLAAIDSIGSRAALVDLASTRDSYRMQAACGAIHHLKNRKELLAKVIARVPEQDAHLVHLDSELQPFSPEFRFYQQWTPPRPKSLPTILPERLFDD